jgi:hypothetical protein
LGKLRPVTALKVLATQPALNDHAATQARRP